MPGTLKDEDAWIDVLRSFQELMARLVSLQASLSQLCSFVTVVLPEVEPDTGNSGETCMVLVKARNCLFTTDAGSSFTVVLPENKPDIRRCKPCFVFSQ